MAKTTTTRCDVAAILLAAIDHRVGETQIICNNIDYLSIFAYVSAWHPSNHTSMICSSAAAPTFPGMM